MSAIEALVHIRDEAALRSTKPNDAWSDVFHMTQDALDELAAERHDATGPAIMEEKVICTTCGGPVHVYSPDFDSAELRHGGLDA